MNQPTTPLDRCECGAIADAPLTVYNGMYDLAVCTPCWLAPDTIATEALVAAAAVDVLDDAVVLGAIETELASRDIATGTPPAALVASVHARRAEWY